MLKKHNVRANIIEGYRQATYKPASPNRLKFRKEFNSSDERPLLETREIHILSLAGCGIREIRQKLFYLINISVHGTRFSAIEENPVCTRV